MASVTISHLSENLVQEIIVKRNEDYEVAYSNI